MKIIRTIAEIRVVLHPLRVAHSVGLVPTMGALHHGHLSLIEASKKDNDYTVCSIFVNPTQFNNSEDLKFYPRTPEQDLEMLREAGCDVVFMPEVAEMYSGTLRTSLNFSSLETEMEGKYRQGHFNGVGIVVSKLLNIMLPHRAYFGQKDLQQFVIIRQMVNDLSMNTDIIACPIIREKDGLAMSSRNLRLMPQERELAPKIYEAICLCANILKAGGSVPDARKEALDFLDKFGVFRTEYIDVVDMQSLEPIVQFENPAQTAVCIASHLGNVRLIDNLMVHQI